MLRKKDLYVNHAKMLNSSCFLENRTFITPPLLLYLDLGLVCKKIHRFVEYILVKCFKKIVLSAVNARPEEDENPNSSAIAETRKLPSNSSYGYQIMDRSHQTVTKILRDENTWGYQHKILQAFGSHQWSIVWSGIGEGRDWAERTNPCWVLHTPIR